MILAGVFVSLGSIRMDPDSEKEPGDDSAEKRGTSNDDEAKLSIR